MPLMQPDTDSSNEATVIGTGTPGVKQPSEDQAATNQPGAEADDPVSEGDEPVDEGRENEAHDDGAGEDSDETDVPKLQYKLKEAAKARKELAEAQRKIGELEQAAKGFKLLMEHPNPEKILRSLREAGFGKSDSGQGAEASDDGHDFVPKGDYGFDEKTDQALNKKLNATLKAFMGQLQEVLAPVAQEVNVSRETRQENEWGKLRSASNYTTGADKWKEQTFQLMKSKGLSMEDALILASKGEARLLKAKSVNGKPGTKTPSLLSVRGAARDSTATTPKKTTSLREALIWAANQAKNADD